MFNDKFQLTLFFSLPFYPSKKRNLFFHGHIALGIEDMVYQIFDPKLLKSDFMVSIMPINEWLYNNSKMWVDKDPISQTYRYVHLYKTSELQRTTVFYCGLNGLDNDVVLRAKDYFRAIDQDYSQKKIKFTFFKNNCSELVSNFFCKEGLIKQNTFNIIPAPFFKNFVSAIKEGSYNYKVGVLEKKKGSEFKTHRFCIGLSLNNSYKDMVSWLDRL